MKAPSPRWIPAAAALIGLAAAFVATPLLFPAPAQAAQPRAALDPRLEADQDLTRLGGVLVAIAGLGYGTLWLVRRVKGHVPTRRRGRTLEILDSLPLGQQRTLAVARVYDRVFVLGLAKERVSLIQELREDETGLDTAQATAHEAGSESAGEDSALRSLLKPWGRPAAPRGVSGGEAATRSSAWRQALKRVTVAELEKREAEPAVEELL